MGLYNRINAWLRGLSRGKYAVFLGLSGGAGVLIAGLLLNTEFFLVQALMMAAVIFSWSTLLGSISRQGSEADDNRKERTISL
jgi:hypothetical protein